METDHVNGGIVFEPETIELMRVALEEAWAQLRPEEQARHTKSDLAERILRAAAHGERDLVRLRCSALLHVAVPTLISKP
jgi:hypothetical protein